MTAWGPAATGLNRASKLESASANVNTEDANDDRKQGSNDESPDELEVNDEDEVLAHVLALQGDRYGDGQNQE